MASSLEGEYTHSTETQFQPNTQDNSQEEWPRWVQGDVTTETVTVEYQEGAWTIWGPEAHPKEIVIKDDLITKYNFQESGEGPTPPPVPTMSITVSVYNSDDWSSTWWSLDQTVITGIPEWFKIHWSSCYSDGKIAVIYNWSDIGEWTVYTTIHLTTEDSYASDGWQYYEADDDNWKAIDHTPIVDWMQIRARVKALAPEYLQFSSFNASTWQPWGCALNKAYIEWVDSLGKAYWNSTYSGWTILDITNSNCYKIEEIEAVLDEGMQLLTWQYYSEQYDRWITIPPNTETDVSNWMKIRAVVYEAGNISITASVWDITRDQEVDPEDAYVNPSVTNNMPEWAAVDRNTSYHDWKVLQGRMPIDEYSSVIISNTTLYIRNIAYEFLKWQYYNEATSQWEDIITPVTIYSWMLVRAALRNKCY